MKHKLLKHFSIITFMTVERVARVLCYNSISISLKCLINWHLCAFVCERLLHCISFFNAVHAYLMRRRFANGLALRKVKEALCCSVVVKGLGLQLTESTAVAVDTQISPSLHLCLGSPSQCLHQLTVTKNMRPRSLL